MSSVEWAGLAIVLALVFIVHQHLMLRKLMHTIVGIATGKVEVRADGRDIYIKRVN